MPAALAEIAFISNPCEKIKLSMPSFRAKAAEALFKGIQEYLGEEAKAVDKKEMSLEEAKKAVKEKFGFDENTMLYLEMYRYGEALIRRLAEGR